MIPSLRWTNWQYEFHKAVDPLLSPSLPTEKKDTQRYRESFIMITFAFRYLSVSRSGFCEKPCFDGRPSTLGFPYVKGRPRTCSFSDSRVPCTSTLLCSKLRPPVELPEKPLAIATQYLHTDHPVPAGRLFFSRLVLEEHTPLTFLPPPPNSSRTDALLGNSMHFPVDLGLGETR